MIALWENRRQTLAVIPDACIFLSMGMNLAVGMGFTDYLLSTHDRFSWFIGVIVGIIVSSIFFKYILKKHFVLLSSVLVIVAAILNILWTYDEIKTLALRYINGIGTGLIIVPFIVNCSESVDTRKRGSALGLEQFCIALGFLLQATVTQLSSTSDLLSPTCLHGIFCLCFGLIALVLATAVIESPIFYIRQDNEAAALNALTNLELPTAQSGEKRQLLKEHTNYVYNNEDLGLGGSILHGLGPLIKMILNRLVVALTFSLPYSTQLTIGMEYGITTGFPWPMILSLIFRVLGVFGGMTRSDLIGRKFLSLVGLLVMGFLSIGVAKFFESHDFIYALASKFDMSVGCMLLVLMQFFAGLYAPTSTIYLSEAFPMLVKPYLIAICVCLENAVHILLIIVFRYNIYALTIFNIFTSAYLFGCFILFLITIPETKLTTLMEAQESFSAWMNLPSWS